jgi:hypothetical protein
MGFQQEDLKLAGHDTHMRGIIFMGSYREAITIRSFYEVFVYRDKKLTPTALSFPVATLHIPEATIISCYYKSQFRDVLMITV